MKEWLISLWLNNHLLLEYFLWREVSAYPKFATYYQSYETDLMIKWWDKKYMPEFGMQRSNFMPRCSIKKYVFLNWNWIYQALFIICTKPLKNETKNKTKI